MIEPCYSEDGITIYNADCMEVLPRLGAVDLVLTDPPYNVGFDYGENHNDSLSRDDFRDWIGRWLPLCLSIAPTVLVTTGQVNLVTYAEVQPWKWLLCWWKPAAMGRSPVGFCNWEPVAMWGRGSNAGNDFVKAPIISDASIDGHPCPKPLGWAKGLIELFPSAKTILDPFCGSGTTLVAAKRLGKQATGIEISEKYCEIAVNRLRQMELFSQPV